MLTPKCFINYHKWTNTVGLIIHYEHFMMTGCITEMGGTGWEIHELEPPGDNYIEIPFEAAKLLSLLVDRENPLSGDEEEKIKNNKWCVITYPEPLGGPWEWISGLMPYKAYLNAREAGYYRHSGYSIYIFDNFKEAEKAYKEITAAET